MTDHIRKTFFRGLTDWSILFLSVALLNQSAAQSIAANDTVKKAGSSSTKTTTPKMAPSATNVLIKTEGDKLTYNTPQGVIIIEKTDSTPTYKITTEHVKILSQVEDGRKDWKGETWNNLEAGRIMEATYPILKDFFQSTKAPEPLLCEVFGNEAGFFAGMNKDGINHLNGQHPGGYSHPGNGKGYTYFQGAGVYWTHYLMIHEAVHTFQMISGTTCSCPGEDIANMLGGGHKWDGNTFRLGISFPQSAPGDAAGDALKNFRNKTQNGQTPKDAQALFDAMGGRYFLNYLISTDPAAFKSIFFEQSNKLSLNERWAKHYGSSELKSDINASVIACFTRMQKDGNYGGFSSWAEAIAGDPTAEIMVKISKLQEILGNDAPPSLALLSTKIQAVKNKASSGNSSKGNKAPDLKKMTTQTASLKSEANLVWKNSAPNLLKEISASKATPEKIQEATKIISL